MPKKGPPRPPPSWRIEVAHARDLPGFVAYVYPPAGQAWKYAVASSELAAAVKEARFWLSGRAAIDPASVPVTPRKECRCATST